MAFTEDDLRGEYSERTEEWKRKYQESERLLQGYRKEHGKLELFFDNVKSSIVPLRDREPITYTNTVKTGTSIVPVMHITDTHLGMVQEPNEIEDFNEYNPLVAKRRSITFAEEFTKWVGYQRLAYKIEELAILMTGDLISGDIHDELRITNAFPSPVQVAETAAILAEQVQILQPHFKKVTIHFITEDNHSRLTAKPQCKEAGFNSFNYLVGILLQAYLSNMSNVEMNIYPMLEKVVNVNDRLYLLTHGHAIKGWMGVPWYGVERKVGKEAQARLQIIMQEIERAKSVGFNKYIFGHFHTPFDSTWYSCGASLSGTDAYDHQAGRYATPGQSAWLTHPKHGEFNRINFNLV